jgi:hypothetical protein
MHKCQSNCDFGEIILCHQNDVYLGLKYKVHFGCKSEKILCKGK